MDEWVDARLAEAGLHRTGDITCVHDRPWATVYTAPTTGGLVWLKVPGPGSRFEVPLYELLARVAPDRIPHPIALDLDLGLLLLPDGGATLGAQLGELDVTEALVTTLPQYGQLQRDLVPHTDNLLSFGVTDMRPAIMPARFDEAVAVAGPPRAVREMRATFAEWCARLGASPIPASLDHNDLHLWNIFFAGGQARFYDWGDSVVSHPFASLLFLVAVVRDKLGAGPDDPVVTRPRDAYLEVWSDVAPRAELVAEQELACWVGKVARALTWDRTLRAHGYDQAREFADAPRQHLTGLLAGSWSDLSNEP